MKRDNLSIIPWLFAALALSGCALDEGDDPDTLARSEDALVNGNALSPEALDPAATLTPAALGATPLTLDALNPAARAAIQDPSASGALSRQLLLFTVSCALAPAQSFVFTWVDEAGAHDEVYPGLVALAPSWTTQPLGLSDQHWVSACIISRVNYLGAAVLISSRGTAGRLLTKTGNEYQRYPMQEGAFWGNVFASPPVAYACDYTPDDGHSRAHYRDCAAGYLDDSGALHSCGIIQRVGSCDTYCTPLMKNGLYHQACGTSTLLAVAGSVNEQGFVQQVITVFLP